MLSEPIVEETIELLEVVDDYDVVDTDDQDAVGTIDLSAEFEELQAVEEQSDVEAMASIEAFDVDAAEIATDDTDAIEVLETPEIVEAVEPVAPQLHLIEVDALKEFAASVEAMIAVEPIAVAGAAGPSSSKICSHAVNRLSRRRSVPGAAGRRSKA